ncbi:hypothetical protein Tco_0611479 [Tanacetum coccineum]
MEADDQAIQTILLGLPEDIYVAVDSCETTQEIWLRVQQMMKGSDIGIQEKKAKLFNEWETFTSTDGESIESYYHCFSKLMNDFKRNKHFPEKISSIQTKLLTPTNNNQRISSNPRNRQIAQPGMNIGQDRQMQKVGGNVQNLGVQNIGNQNGLIVVPGIANQNPNRNGNVVAVQAKGNAIENNADLDKIEEVNANCILMANFQQASTSGTQTDKAPVYDSDGLVKVYNYDNCYDNEIFNMFTQEEQYTELLEPIPESHQVQQNDSNVISKVSNMEQDRGIIDQHPATAEETHAYFESLYNNLAIEVEKVNSINRKMKETNANLTIELARYKNQEKCFEISQEKYDKLERCYQKSVYQEQCLTKKINALHLSSGKQITTLNEEISNLNKQLSKEKSTVSSLLEEKKKLKSDFKIREDELLDKQIQLENKIKELDNILVKTGQSIQTMHMLSPKPDSFYHTEQKMALGYQNPFYLKQAQQKQQSLYNGKVLLEKHDPPAVYDSEETLQLAQEILVVLSVSTASINNSTACLSDATVYAYLATQPNGSQVVHEDLEQIHEDDNDEMDLKWQLALLSMKARKFYQRTGKKIIINGSDIAEILRVRQWKTNISQDSSRRTVNVEESSSKAMLAIDGTGFDWSYMADEEASTNFALMAFSDSEIAVLKRDASFNESDINALKKQVERLKKEKEDNQFKIDNFENASKSLDQLIGNQISDNNKKGLGYNVVPPPLTGLFAPPSIDLSNSGLEKFKQPEFEGYGVKVNKGASENVSKEVKKTSDAPIIEDWVSDCDEDETVVLESLNVQKPKQVDQPRKVSQNPRNNSTSWNTPMPKKLGVGFQFTPKACFVCGSFNHLIKECDFHDKRMVQKPVLNNVKKGTGQKEVRPVWTNAMRVNHQKISNSRRNFSPTTVLTKSGLVPFSIARQSFSRTKAPVSVARSFNIVVPSVNVAKSRTNVFQKSHSPLRRPFYQQTTHKIDKFE